MSATRPRTVTPCRCRPLHHGERVDAESLNRAAEERLRKRQRAAGEVDCLIVPGFTPRLGWRAHHLHPLPEESCARAAADVRAGVADCVIVSGGAVHGPANEAVLMREALLALGIGEDRILVEPCARHTTTNLRNAARIMFAHGLRTAYVVAPDVAYRRPLDHLLRLRRQAFYIGYPHVSSLALRCHLTLGYSVGRLEWVRPWHIRFVPAHACLRESTLPCAEGDP